MKKENLLISACLLGVPCRYDGKSKYYPEIESLKEKYNLIPVCPEIYGGLTTPRMPSERVGDSVIMADGKDVTENYIRGAEAAYRIFCECDCKFAVLKAKSPSCGKDKIYDGSFSGTLSERSGVTAEYLISKEIKVYSEEELEDL